MRRFVLFAVLFGNGLWNFTAVAVTYTTLDDPLASTGNTFPKGISGNNVVGYYLSPAMDGAHGFQYNSSTWTKLDDPLANNGTQATAVSGSNIIGQYGDFSAINHGFLYNGSTWTTLDDPLASAGNTFPKGMSGNNVIGYYLSPAMDGAHGFLYNGSTWTNLDDPLANNGTKATAISGGNIVGQYGDLLGINHGFLYNGSTWTTLDDPLASSGNTFLTGISGSYMVGYYLSPAMDGAHGCLYDGTTWTTLDDLVPGANNTKLLGISGNMIVGQYSDTSGINRGFIANASDLVISVPEPSTLALLSAGVIGLICRTWRRRSKLTGESTSQDEIESPAILSFPTYSESNRKAA